MVEKIATAELPVFL